MEQQNSGPSSAVAPASSGQQIHTFRYRALRIVTALSKQWMQTGVLSGNEEAKTSRKLRPGPEDERKSRLAEKGRNYESFTFDIGGCGTHYRWLGFGISAGLTTGCGLPRP
jgi:hypothetical protein